MANIEAHDTNRVMSCINFDVDTYSLVFKLRPLVSNITEKLQVFVLPFSGVIHGLGGR